MATCRSGLCFTEEEEHDLLELCSETAVELQCLTLETGCTGPAAASPCLRLGSNSSGPHHLRRSYHHCLGQNYKGIPTGTTCFFALVLARSHKCSLLSQKK